MNQGAPINILIVEDNPGDVRLIMEAFKEAKIDNRLFVVEDGAEAISYLKRENKFKDAVIPDMILLDLNLPRRDGREVLTYIKSDLRLKIIPVIIMTTSSSDTDILQAYNLQANAYIQKPVDLDQFFHIIQSIEDFWLKFVRFPPLQA